MMRRGSGAAFFVGTVYCRVTSHFKNRLPFAGNKLRCINHKRCRNVETTCKFRSRLLLPDKLFLAAVRAEERVDVGSLLQRKPHTLRMKPGNSKTIHIIAWHHTLHMLNVVPTNMLWLAHNPVLSVHKLSRSDHGSDAPGCSYLVFLQREPNV